MAIIKCPECGKEISDKANSCPNCGAPINIHTEKSDNKKSKIYIIIISIILVGCVIGTIFLYFNKRVDLVAKSVVKVHCYDTDGTELATGSGFIIYDGETFVTNYHVLAAGLELSIETEGGATFEVNRLIAYSEEDDLAILGVNGDTGIKPIKFDTNRPTKGDKIYAIGSPQGFKNTISDGVVSSIYDDSEGNIDIIQISAPISPGSSGGVLLNSSCRAIGVTSSGYSSAEYQNINFAIPIKKVEDLYKQRITTSLEDLISEIHKNDHDCAFERLDDNNIFTLESAFSYAAELDGTDVLLIGYYSSSYNDFLYIYNDKELIRYGGQDYLSGGTDGIYNEEKKIIGMRQNSLLYHDDKELKPGDKVAVYCKLTAEPIYEIWYNGKPVGDDNGRISVDELLYGDRILDHYTYRIEAIEIANMDEN